MMLDPVLFARPVINWHKRHGRRELPWQLDKTAYCVWLSEIMLQQTQVATVIPYYRRFTQRFPNLRALADASIDDVLQSWQGLGYYARARNLHRSAQIIRDQHDGQFPQAFDQVIALPGIGRSTAGAILTFAYQQSWPILDGNVKRVLARCFSIAGGYGQAKTMQRLWQMTESLTPERDTGRFNQGMMDIGALLCLKSRPLCDDCPLSQHCESFKHETQQLYPEKTPRKLKPRKKTLMLLQRFQDSVLLYRRPAQGIWGGLWSLPEVDLPAQIGEWQLRHLHQTKPPRMLKPDMLKHQFTHFSLDISVALIELDRLPDQVADDGDFEFAALDKLSDYALPTPVRKILDLELAIAPEVSARVND